jgi:guanylate kinase
VVRRLVETDPRFWLSRSWTTRARRVGEDEDAYTFVDTATFLERVAAGGFLEWATVLGEHYGTPYPEAPPGRDIVLEIDVQGAEQVLERCEDVVVVLLVPPSRAEQRRRLEGRGDPPEQVERRIALGELEVERARRIARAVVVNEDVDKSAAELVAIVDRARRQASA